MHASPVPHHTLLIRSLAALLCVGIFALASSPAAAQTPATPSTLAPVLGTELFLPHAEMGEPFAGRIFCEEKVTEIPHHECLALAELYYATSGPNWFDATWPTWMEDGMPCNWGIVTCEAGTVVELATSWEFTRKGTIPAALGNLTNLRRLHLQGDFVGAIPPELGNLNALESFILVGNMHGPIPAALGNLFALRYLHIGGDHLRGPIPPELGNLTNLEYLNFSRAPRLGGTIPPELGNLQNLKILNITSSLLHGPIPPELGNLMNLAGLYIIYSDVSGEIPPELGQLGNLHALQIRGNSLTGALPPALANLTNLHSLWIGEDDVCMPDDAELQSWFENIPSTSMRPSPCPVEG